MAGLVPLAEIAEMVGVSASTVSRYMNKKCVAPRTAQRIEACLAAKGYPVAVSRVPFAPVGLAGESAPVRMAAPGSGTGGAVCVLIVGQTENVFRMPALPELFDGVQRAAARHRKQVSFVSYPGDGPLPMEAIGPHCPGVLVLDRDRAPSPELVAFLDTHPSVLLLRRYADERRRFDQVGYDNRVVGEMAATYLRDAGCRSFLYASHNPAHVAFMQRREDFKMALTTFGLDAPVVVEEDGPAALRGRLERLFADGLRPDGVFVAADDLLPQVWLAARLSGIALALESADGRGMHVVGCNNDPVFIRPMHPRPATVDLHLAMLGERAFDLLARRMAGHVDDHPAQWVITPELLPAEASPEPSAPVRRPRSSRRAVASFS